MDSNDKMQHSGRVLLARARPSDSLSHESLLACHSASQLDTWWLWPSWLRRQIVALKIVGSSPISHPIKNPLRFAGGIFYRVADGMIKRGADATHRGGTGPHALRAQDDSGFRHDPHKLHRWSGSSLCRPEREAREDPFPLHPKDARRPTVAK